MRKIIVLVVGSVLLAIFFVMMNMHAPKKIAYMYEGVIYQLGANNKEYTPTIITIEGEIKRDGNGRKTFHGTIDIEGIENPVPRNQQDLQILLGSGGSPLSYHYLQNGTLKIHRLGWIYTTEDLSQFTIKMEPSFYETGQGESQQEDWMITAPATNKEEALKISNELMRMWLSKQKLE